MSDDVGSEAITFRASTPEDAPLLKEILLDDQVLRYFPMCDEREVDDSVRIWLSYADKGAAFTALYDGEPVGMATIYLQPFEKLKHQALFAIAIDKKMRGKGIGTHMMNHLISAAKNLGLTRLHLEVYQGNAAYSLYKRLGFKEYGRHPRFLKEGPKRYLTKILMQKEI